MCDSSRVNMVRALLRPYEYRAWAQSNWVLVRIWQGCGFAFRYHKPPHLLRKLGPKLLQEHFSLINQSLSMCFFLVVTCYERRKAHAMLWPCRSSQGHGTACPSRDGLCATCPCSASSATTQSSTKIVVRSIPILLTMIRTYGCKSGNSTLQKRRSVKLLD